MLNIFAVSDGTGITTERVVGAAVIQFDSPRIQIIRYEDVLTSERVKEIVREAADKCGFVVHTLV